MVKDFELSFDAPGNDLKAGMAPRFRALAPGKYKLCCTCGDAHRSEAGADFWMGEITSGEVEFTLAAADSAAAVEAPKKRKAE